MAKCLMVQGTMSGVGKSLLTAALCRIFLQDGLRVAPFKSQNMALNSYITRDGLEMGRAQVVQAYAAGKEPDVRMNPILLKPSSDTGSQLIVNGRVQGEYRARDYFKMKKSLIPEILAAYNSLSAENDIIVIEGAGSPAEINLKADDIVNMGLAELVDAPVLLVGDIDPGGVFAQLYGTLALLEEKERRRVLGTVINKFRGDVDILTPGIRMLEELTGVPCYGVVPYTNVQLDDEDSMASCLKVKQVHKPIDIAILRLPRISNFTDFTPLEQHGALGCRYVGALRELRDPDLVILPGTKSTMDDLLWLRQSGLEMAVKQLAARGIPVLGVCGGYQMLGRTLQDPYQVERGGTMTGMGLLPCETVFAREKIRTRVRGIVQAEPLSNVSVEAYEIHMGETTVSGGTPFCMIEKPDLADAGEQPLCVPDGVACGNILGTYLHGLFDSGEMVSALAAWLLTRKGLAVEDYPVEDHIGYQERQLNLLADAVRRSLDMEAIYRGMRCFEGRSQ